LAYVDHPLGPRSSKILREYQLAELGRQVQAIADPAARVIALAQLGGEALRSGDHARGQENFREARARLEALPSGFDKGLGSSHLALELDKSGHVVEATDLFLGAAQEAQALREGFTSQPLERYQSSFDLLHTLGLHLHMARRFIESEKVFAAAAQLS